MESEKNRETYYVASLASHIMKIAEYNNLIKKGVPHNEAMKVVVQSKFFWDLNKMAAQTGNFDTESVRRSLTALVHAESTLKRYSVNKRLFMELLIPFTLPWKSSST